jgi:hypothetical protein
MLVGQESCWRCPDGKYQAQTGQTYCSIAQEGSVLVVDSQKRVQSLLICPLFGVDCSKGTLAYIGGVWHGEVALKPNCTANYKECTRFYSCVNEGCPEAGATEMRCKEGYKGPLCASCDEGHYLKLRECEKCPKVKVGGLILWLALFLLPVCLIYPTYQRYRRYLGLHEVMPYFKIMISFITIVPTIDTNYGVHWPSDFKTVLDVLSICCLDVSSIFQAGLRIECFGGYSFYGMLIGQVALTVVIAGAIWWRGLVNKPPGKLMGQTTSWWLVHFAVFIYPTASNNLTKTFACHDVDGTRYLRADYNFECDTNTWWTAVALASVLVIVFVVGFPLLTFYQLWTYRLSDSGSDRSSSGLSSRLPGLRFLRDDYIDTGPSWMHATQMWEGIEMVRSPFFPYLDLRLSLLPLSPSRGPSTSSNSRPFFLP